MAIDKDVRLACEAKLKLGVSVKDIASQLDMKVVTVYSIKQKLDKQKPDEMVEQLHKVDAAVIANIVHEAKKELPQGSTMAAQMDEVVDGAAGLKKLDMAFQTTMSGVLRRFDLMLMDQDLAIKDVVLIANTTATAYEKVFAAGTNIHIGDNNTSNNQLTMFKNKQGV